MKVGWKVECVHKQRALLPFFFLLPFLYKVKDNFFVSIYYFIIITFFLSCVIFSRYKRHFRYCCRVGFPSDLDLDFCSGFCEGFLDVSHCYGSAEAWRWATACDFSDDFTVFRLYGAIVPGWRAWNTLE